MDTCNYVCIAVSIMKHMHGKSVAQQSVAAGYTLGPSTGLVPHLHALIFHIVKQSWKRDKLLQNGKHACVRELRRWIQWRCSIPWVMRVMGAAISSMQHENLNAIRSGAHDSWSLKTSSSLPYGTTPEYSKTIANVNWRTTNSWTVTGACLREYS